MTSKICFVLHGPLASNSGYHAIGIANELATMGRQVDIVTPIGGPRPQALLESVANHSFEEYVARIRGPVLPLFHCWTPRNLVIDFVDDCSRRAGRRPRYVVHLEDSEELIGRGQLGLSAAEYRLVENGFRSIEVPAHLSHPARARKFLLEASGVTALNPDLLVNWELNCPATHFWPGYDKTLDWAAGSNHGYRSKLRLPADSLLTVYTGNVHPANAAEVTSLYLAVALVRRMGLPLILLRTGENFAPVGGLEAELLKAVEINLGFVERSELPLLVSSADMLVQPGNRDEWNRFRVPSKLPEFLASGVCVVCPKVNLGLALSHEENAIVLDDANAENIAQAFLKWLPRPGERQRIGHAGARFAARHLDWSVAAQRVSTMYELVA